MLSFISAWELSQLHKASRDDRLHKSNQDASAQLLSHVVGRTGASAFLPQAVVNAYNSYKDDFMCGGYNMVLIRPEVSIQGLGAWATFVRESTREEKNPFFAGFEDAIGGVLDGQGCLK